MGESITRYVDGTLDYGLVHKLYTNIYKYKNNQKQ
jgi:hypothetical protein